MNNNLQLPRSSHVTIYHITDVLRDRQVFWSGERSQLDSMLSMARLLECRGLQVLDGLHQ